MLDSTKRAATRRNVQLARRYKAMADFKKTTEQIRLIEKGIIDYKLTIKNHNSLKNNHNK